MTQFITINDSFVSPDLADLEILSYPGPDPLLLSPDGVPGRFVLKIEQLVYSSLEKEGFIPRSPGSGVRRFNLAVCGGSPDSKVTWKPALTLGDCVFLVAVDRDKWKRVQNERVPRLDDGPVIYSLQGIFYKSSGWQMDVSGELNDTMEEIAQRVGDRPIRLVDWQTCPHWRRREYAIIPELDIRDILNPALVGPPDEIKIETLLYCEDCGAK